MIDGRKSVTSFKLAAAYSAAVIALLWPAILNGQAIFFFDTPAYFKAAARGLQVVLGLDSAWLTEPSELAQRAAQSAAKPRGDGQISAGRSIYYGLLVLLPSRINLWLALIVQALIILWGLALTARTFNARSWYLAPILAIVLALVSTLGFFVSYLMPDFLTGLTVLALACMLTRWERMGTWVKVQWFILLVLSLSAHTSHLIIAAALLPLGLLANWRILSDFSWKAGGVVAMALVVAIAMQLSVSLAVSSVYGQPYANPPFLTARIVADPPGYRFLRETCPQSGFKVCDYLQKLPTDSDTFLWSKQPRESVFGTASSDVRKELSAEQFRFALAVFEHDPWSLLASSLSNAARQFTMVSLREFAYTDNLKLYLIREIPAGMTSELRDQRLFADRMPLRIPDMLYIAVALTSFVVVVVYLVASFSNPLENRRELWLMIFLSLSGLLVNAAITGALSTPHDRYQARLIWLLPALLFFISAARAGYLLSDERTEV